MRYGGVQWFAQHIYLYAAFDIVISIRRNLEEPGGVQAGLVSWGVNFIVARNSLIMTRGNPKTGECM